VVRAHLPRTGHKTLLDPLPQLTLTGVRLTLTNPNYLTNLVCGMAYWRIGYCTKGTPFYVTFRPFTLEPPGFSICRKTYFSSVHVSGTRQSLNASCRKKPPHTHIHLGCCLIVYCDSVLVDIVLYI
jgi:hypothetical protein